MNGDPGSECVEGWGDELIRRYRPIVIVAAVCVFAACLALGGCASQPIEAQLATACNQIATAYTEAAILKAGGKLSATQIASINATIPIAVQACDPSNPPADINAAILSLTTALQTVTLAQAGVH